MRINPNHWKQVLQRLINEHNWQHASKRKIVSNKTMHERAHFLFHFFGELRRNDECNHKVDPRNLGSRHIQFMVDRWVKRGLAAGTIQLYLSYLRAFSEWIGKPGLVLPAERYVSDPALVRRSYAAQNDKSWSANGINTDDVIERVAKCDPFVGAQLQMCCAYGARVKEAIMYRPHLAEMEGKLLLIKEWSCESYLEIKRGTKGGRMRVVPIDTEEKRAALDRAKRIALHETSSLGHPELSLKQSINRFYNILKRCGVTAAKLGVTAHGLRHEYANDRYEQAAVADSGRESDGPHA